MVRQFRDIMNLIGSRKIPFVQIPFAHQERLSVPESRSPPRKHMWEV